MNKMLVLLCGVLCTGTVSVYGAAEPIKPEPTVSGGFELLPADSVSKIIGYLPYRTLALLGQTSSFFYSMARENSPRRLWGTQKIQSRVIVAGSFGSNPVSLSFSANENRLAACCPDGKARLFDVETGEELRVLPLQDVENHLKFSPVDNDLLVLCSFDSRDAEVMNLATTEAPRPIVFNHHWRPHVIFSNNGQLLALEAESEPHVWVSTISADKKVQEPRKLKSFYNYSISSLAFVPENKLLVAASQPGSRILEIYEIDRENGKTLKTFAISNPPNSGVMSYSLNERDNPVFSPDGAKIAFQLSVFCEPRQEHLIVWDVIHNNQKIDIDFSSELQALAFSPDSKIIAAKLKDCIMLVDAETGQTIAKLQPPENVRTSSDDWTYIVSRRGRKVIRSSFVHWPLVFSPHGDMIASGYDGNIVLWLVVK